MKRTATLHAALSGLLVLAVMFGGTAAAQYRTPLMYDPQPSDLRIPAPPEVRLGKAANAQATFVVNFLPPGKNTFDDTCTTWSGPAMTAFNYAVSIWASQLQSSVPIRINACYASDLGAGVLGSAGPYLRTFAGSPIPGTLYPAALANALAGTDLGPTQVDIEASFSSTFSWYYGTDGNVPVGQVDFVSVVLHEIGHGLGFTGGLGVSATSGAGVWEFSVPLVYDRFTENAGGTSLLNATSFPNPSAALATALRSNNVFFDGTNANAGNGGARVALYAPAAWNEGSSYSHLAESFNNTPNALMTYSLASREAIHSPGPVTLGILRDLGWQLQTASTADVAVTQTINANPATAGKDAIVTMTATNNGPGTATGVTLTATYDATASVIWASPGCVKQGVTAVYLCTIGTLGNGASSQFKLVLRKSAAGSVSNTAAVATSTTDSNAGNNSSILNVSVVTGAVGVPVQRYRLYSPVTLEHHFTTDFNEYTVLGQSGGWVQEGTVGSVFNNPRVYNGVTAMPYYRLYNDFNHWHHWTTDANEYYTLIGFPGWNGEGVDGYILPTSTAGTIQLYRLVYPNGTGLHHWTTDANEYATLIASFGWIGEGGSGFVLQ